MIILTDLSEVLIRGVYGVEKIIEETYGEAVADRFVKRRHETEPFFLEMMRGHMTENEYWTIFFENDEDEWPLSAGLVLTLISMNFANGMQSAMGVYQRIIEYPVRINDATIRQSGCPEIWIVSDHFAERREELELIHPDVFDVISKQIWSYDYGLVKRDKGFFHRLLFTNHLRPEEVIFIDDQTVNLWAAEEADIKGIRYEDPIQLETELRSYGFRFKPD